MTVQITGARAEIELALKVAEIPGGKVKDLHSIVWIEAAQIATEVAAAVVRVGCKVHDCSADESLR